MLTLDEIAFLESKGFKPEDVFDGTRYSTILAKEMARKAGQPLMLGSRCQKAGHRLRTRGGHCWQCDPKKLAYQSRHTAEGYVYVLGSKETRLFKVGCSGNLYQRLDRINYQAYGGARDWKPIWHMRIAETGHVETDIHAKLAEYGIEGTYVKDGVQQATRELFRTSKMRVLTAVYQVIGPTVNEGTLADDHDQYDWEA